MCLRVTDKQLLENILVRKVANTSLLRKLFISTVANTDESATEPNSNKLGNIAAFRMGCQNNN